MIDIYEYIYFCKDIPINVENCWTIDSKHKRGLNFVGWKMISNDKILIYKNVWINFVNQIENMQHNNWHKETQRNVEIEMWQK